MASWGMEPFLPAAPTMAVGPISWTACAKSVSETPSEAGRWNSAFSGDKVPSCRPANTTPCTNKGRFRSQQGKFQRRRV